MADWGRTMTIYQRRSSRLSINSFHEKVFFFGCCGGPAPRWHGAAARTDGPWVRPPPPGPGIQPCQNSSLPAATNLEPRFYCFLCKGADDPDARPAGSCNDMIDDEHHSFYKTLTLTEAFAFDYKP